MSVLKFEVNKSYKTRDGAIAVIHRIDDNGKYPLMGTVMDLPETWMSNGRYYEADMSDYDLVEEVFTGLAKPESLTAPQPAPKTNNHPPVWPLVMVDMAQRDAEGRKKYGTPLQPHNGRDVLVDAYQEALDLAVYLRQAIYERDGK